MKLCFSDSLTSWLNHKDFSLGTAVLSEPLLDKRIFIFWGYARSKLDKAKFHLATNGDLLDQSMIEAPLENAFDTIRVTLHALSHPVIDIIANLPDKYRDRIWVTDQGWRRNLLDWGGVITK